MDITLPAPLHACYADDESLVAVCRNKDSLHWSWGGTLVEIQVGEDGYHKLPRDTQGPFLNGFPGALFHPARKDVVFLVRIYIMDLAVQRRKSTWHPSDSILSLSPSLTFTSAAKNLFGTTVVKYVQQGPGLPFVAAKRYARTVPHPLEFGPQGEPEEPLDDDWNMDVSPSMRKTNNHGRYSLFYFFLFSLIGEMATHNIETQCFNVVTEKFFCPTLTFANPLGVTRSRRHGAAPQPRSRLFDRRVSVAEQVQIWHNQFFSLTWQVMGWNPHPPSLNATDLLGEGVPVSRAFKVPSTSRTLVKRPSEDQILQRQARQQEYGSGFWRIFADDDLLLTLTDIGYYVVDARGGPGEYDWLKGGMDRKVSLGLHYPHWEHTGLRDLAVEVTYANRELVPQPWVDPEQVEEDMAEYVEESREEDMEDASGSDSDMDVNVDMDSERADLDSEPVLS